MSRRFAKGRYDITDLAELCRDELVTIWREELGHEVPKGLSRPMVLRILAWEFQAKTQGGLKRELRRKLERVGSGEDVPQTKRARPGSKLVREWNGETHVIEVNANGYSWRARDYKSLSAIAKDITGTKWSGPRFFGLTAQRVV